MAWFSSMLHCYWAAAYGRKGSLLGADLSPLGMWRGYMYTYIYPYITHRYTQVHRYIHITPYNVQDWNKVFAVIPPQRSWSPVLASPSMRCPVSINSCKSKRERRRQLRKHQTAAVGLEYAGKKTKLEDCKAVQLCRTHTHENQQSDETNSTQENQRPWCGGNLKTLACCRLLTVFFCAFQWKPTRSNLHTLRLSIVMYCSPCLH